MAPKLGARGTARIVAGERESEVLFTNRAVAEAEAAVGRSIVAILEGYQTGACGMTETVKLLRVGMEAARRDSRAGGRVVTEGDLVTLDFGAVVDGYCSDITRTVAVKANLL